MIIESIFRDRDDFFKEVREKMGLSRKNMTMILTSVMFLSIYGAVMGIAHGVPQSVSSAAKLPILFIVTLFICTPSLYLFNLMFGSRHTPSQTVALVLTAVTVTSVLLMSFAPVTLFFMLTTSEYTFFKLLNVGFFAISGTMGVLFLRHGMAVTVVETEGDTRASTRRMIFWLWVVLYGFVGTQMAWTLSPFLGDPDQAFIVFRQVGGNFYTDVLTSLGMLLGVN